MKLNAYFLAATPLWTRATVASYYPFVEKILVNYDQDGLGWNRSPIDIEGTLEILREMDVDSKIEYRAGSYSSAELTPHQNQVKQRQEALDACADADWVVQLDADEVMAAPETFFACLQQAQDAGYNGLDYPARFFYVHLGGDWFLEKSRRFWKVTSNYPGPLAVRPGVTFNVGRQCDARLFRVDFEARSTEPERAHLPVHRVIAQSEAVYHYSWVRSRALLRGKFENHGALSKSNKAREYQIWNWCGQHPYLATLRSPLLIKRPRFHRHLRFLRRVRVPAPCAEVRAELAHIERQNQADNAPDAASVGTRVTPGA